MGGGVGSGRGGGGGGEGGVGLGVRGDCEWKSKVFVRIQKKNFEGGGQGRVGVRGGGGLIRGWGGEVG